MVMLRRFRGSYCGRSRERHDAAASKLSCQAFVKNECERHVVGMNRKVNRLFTVYEGNARCLRRNGDCSSNRHR